MNRHQTKTAPRLVRDCVADRLGDWVELHEERCRGDRLYRVLVNHRDRVAITVTDQEAAMMRQLSAPAGPIPPTCDSAAGQSLLTHLRDAGYLHHGGSAAHRASHGRRNRLRAFART